MRGGFAQAELRQRLFCARADCAGGGPADAVARGAAHLHARDGAHRVSGVQSRGSLVFANAYVYVCVCLFVCLFVCVCVCVCGCSVCRWAAGAHASAGLQLGVYGQSKQVLVSELHMRDGPVRARARTRAHAVVRDRGSPDDALRGDDGGGAVRHNRVASAGHDEDAAAGHAVRAAPRKRPAAAWKCITVCRAQPGERAAGVRGRGGRGRHRRAAGRRARPVARLPALLRATGPAHDALADAARATAAHALRVDRARMTAWKASAPVSRSPRAPTASAHARRNCTRTVLM